MQSLDEKKNIMREKRDAKVRDHLLQYAPVWIVKEDFVIDEDAIMFEVVFLHPQYDWMKRRYRFDSYNNVLYHMGQTPFPEEQAYEIQQNPPYLETTSQNTVNSYGG